MESILHVNKLISNVYTSFNDKYMLLYDYYTLLLFSYELMFQKNFGNIPAVAFNSMLSMIPKFL